MAKRLFGTAGIRGPYGRVVTPGLAFELGISLALLLGNRPRVVIGHDARLTSPLLATSVASGLMAGGGNALLAGQLPTPVLAYAVRHTRSNAGVVVTASHNPPEDNGLKVFDETGMEYTEDKEEELESKINSVKTLKPWNEVGVLETMSWEKIRDAYLEELEAHLQARANASTPAFVVDCGNGVAGPYTPILLRRMGARVFTSNCQADGTFPGRYPEPRKDVVEPLSPLLDLTGSSALLAHDGDADRLAVVTPRRGFVKQDYLIALYARHKLSEKSGGEIIVSVDVGNAVARVVEEHGGRIIRAKLGKTHEKLREHPNALFAAEPWKLIDPSWGPWVDGILQAGLLLKIMIEEKAESLDQLLDTLKTFPWARIDIKLETSDPHAKTRLYEKVAEQLMAELGDRGEITEIDGVRIDLEDGSWILVRKSGTEAKLRLYAEAPRREDLDKLVERSLALVREKASALGVGLREPVVNRGD